jgi:hypothetical protein
MFGVFDTSSDSAGVSLATEARAPIAAASIAAAARAEPSFTGAVVTADGFAPSGAPGGGGAIAAISAAADCGGNASAAGDRAKTPFATSAATKTTGTLPASGTLGAASDATTACAGSFASSSLEDCFELFPQSFALAVEPPPFEASLAERAQEAPALPESSPTLQESSCG